ncbi:MAG: hypothetical protein ACLRZR_00420 [Turicibacter sp.]
MKVKIYASTEEKGLKSVLKTISEIETELECECEVELSLNEDDYLIK